MKNGTHAPSFIGHIGNYVTWTDIKDTLRLYCLKNQSQRDIKCGTCHLCNSKALSLRYFKLI